MTFENKTLQCVDCKSSFIWTASEQEYFADRNYQQPKRCKMCREMRRKEKEGAGQQ